MKISFFNQPFPLTYRAVSAGMHLTDRAVSADNKNDEITEIAGLPIDVKYDTDSPGRRIYIFRDGYFIESDDNMPYTNVYNMAHKIFIRILGSVISTLMVESHDNYVVSIAKKLAVPSFYRMYIYNKSPLDRTWDNEGYTKPDTIVVLKNRFCGSRTSLVLLDDFFYVAYDDSSMDDATCVHKYNLRGELLEIQVFDVKIYSVINCPIVPIVFGIEGVREYPNDEIFTYTCIETNRQVSSRVLTGDYVGGQAKYPYGSYDCFRETAEQAEKNRHRKNSVGLAELKHEDYHRDPERFMNLQYRWAVDSDEGGHSFLPIIYVNGNLRYYILTDTELLLYVNFDLREFDTARIKTLKKFNVRKFVIPLRAGIEKKLDFHLKNAANLREIDRFAK